MHIHGAAFNRNIGAPYHLQNGLAGHDKVRVFQQQAQQTVFLVSQVNMGAVHSHAVAGVVQQDLMEGINILHFLGGRAARRAFLLAPTEEINAVTQVPMF